MNKLHLGAIQAKVALQVKREMGASCREEAQALAESQLAQEQRAKLASTLAKAQGQVIHHEKRIFQSAESIQERQPIHHVGSIIHHGKVPISSDKTTQAILNQAPQVEVETMKQFKDRCLRQMRNQNEAHKRFEHAMEYQLQQQLQQSTDPDRYFNELMNIDQQSERINRVKNSQGINDEEVSAEVEDAFEEIFTVGTKTETRKKTPAPCWTIPSEPHDIPSPEVEVTLPKPPVKVKAPTWTIPVEPPRRAVTIARFQPFQSQTQTISQQLPARPPLSSYADSKEEVNDRDTKSYASTSTDPPSRHLPELEIHLSPTNVSHGSEVIEVSCCLRFDLVVM